MSKSYPGKTCPGHIQSLSQTLSEFPFGFIYITSSILSVHNASRQDMSCEYPPHTASTARPVASASYPEHPTGVQLIHIMSKPSSVYPRHPASSSRCVHGVPSIRKKHSRYVHGIQRVSAAHTLRPQSILWHRHYIHSIPRASSTSTSYPNHP